MNEYQQQLYDDLITLVEESEAFYYQDFLLHNSVYRVFNYRLASYTEFCKPSAEECRGHMFEVEHEGRDAKAIRLASLPMEKFYNLGENPKTMDLDLSTVVDIADKADGSLITTFQHYLPHMSFFQVFVKSKGSLFSDQAHDAQAYLQRPENRAFAHELDAAERLGFTVIMEYVAPHNRIVLGYETEELRVLGVRSRMDGSYVEYEDVDADNFPEILSRWTKRVHVDDPVEYVKSIPDMQGIEGFVVRLASGQRVKIKTSWYLALHHTKDSINSPRRLFEAVLEEATDDMKSLFHDDPLAIKQIVEMEAYVEEKYNHLADVTLRFYERNKSMERKDYAILGQEELDRLQFGAAMVLYTGREPNFKEILKKAWKSFGLTDGDTSNQDS